MLKNDDLREKMSSIVAQVFTDFSREYGQAAYRKIVIGEGKNARDVVAEWVDRLIESNITPLCVNKAYKKTFTDPRFEVFPPKIRQFIGLCREDPSDFGLPSEEVAYLMACGNSNDEEIHPAVIEASVRVGQHELRTYSSRDLKERFLSVYRVIVSDVMSGKKQFTGHERREITAGPMEEIEVSSRDYVAKMTSLINQKLS